MRVRFDIEFMSSHIKAVKFSLELRYSVYFYFFSIFIKQCTFKFEIIPPQRLSRYTSPWVPGAPGSVVLSSSIDKSNNYIYIMYNIYIFSLVFMIVFFKAYIKRRKYCLTHGLYAYKSHVYLIIVM